MRKVLLLALAMVASITAHAQIKVVEVNRQADTLMFYVNSGLDAIMVYRNPTGYFLAEESTNRFDDCERFYLGKDEEESVTSVLTLVNFCKNDVATTITILDAAGNPFLVKTDSTNGSMRKTMFQNSNIIRIKNANMAGWVHLRKKTLEELAVALSR